MGQYDHKLCALSLWQENDVGYNKLGRMRWVGHGTPFQPHTKMKAVISGLFLF